MSRRTPIHATIVLSVVLLGVSMAAYPGGTQWDHAASGHDFWRNYLCDLARTVALNGEPNPVGSVLARAALTVLAVGLVAFFHTVPRLFREHARLGSSVRVLGFAAAAGALAVVLLPADRFSTFHGVAIVLSGVPGLMASLLAVIGLVREEEAPPSAGRVGLAALVAATVAFGLYVRQFVVEGPGPVAGAVFERLAFLLLLAWMSVVTSAASMAPSPCRPRGDQSPD